MSTGTKNAYARRTQPGDVAVQSFMSLSLEALETLAVCYPDCLKTAVALGVTRDMYDEGNYEAERTNDWTLQEEVVAKWHECMLPHAFGVASGNLASVAAMKTGPLMEMGLVEKLNDPKFKSSIPLLTGYIQDLTLCAHCHVVMPAKLMQNMMESMAMVRRNPSITKNMNSEKMMALGKSTLEGLSPDELMDYMAALGKFQEFGTFLSDKKRAPRFTRTP